jgi:uncharacterized membrane protein YfcA
MSTIILGLIIGVIFGLTGGGGGVFTTPFLIYGLDMPIHQAIGVTLVTLSFTAIAGLLQRSKSRSVDWRVGGVISASGIISSLIGSSLNIMISEDNISLLLAIALILISTMLWFNASRSNSDDVIIVDSKYYYKLSLIGAVAGFLNGLLGISGGIIIVTSLILFMSFSMRKATSVAILFVAIISTVSAVSHYYLLPEIISGVTILFVVSSMTGMVIASYFASVIPETLLKRLLALMVFSVGVAMLAKCFWH